MAIVYNEIAGRLSGIRRLGPAEVTALINHGNALLVDVRGASDFEKGHIAGSKNVQMTQFDPENKQLAPAKSLPVVMVCKVGQTASFCGQAPAQGRLHRRGRARGRHPGLAGSRTCRWSRASAERTGLGKRGTQPHIRSCTARRAIIAGFPPSMRRTGASPGVTDVR